MKSENRNLKKFGTFFAPLLKVFLVTAIIVEMFAAPQTAVAAETFKSGLNPNENIVFSGGKHEVKVTPKLDAKAAYIWLQIQDKNGNAVCNDTHDPFESNVSSTFECTAPDGTYSLSVYVGAEEYGSYTSYFKQGDLKVNIKNGVVSFVDSPVYAGNQKIFTSKRSDASALDYYLRPSKGIESDDPTIVATAKQIVNGLKDDYAKVKAVHDWVANNVWYDYDALNTGKYVELTAVETLKGRKSVCQGFACLTAALLRACGIPTKFISGYALGFSGVKEWTAEIVKSAPPNHAWNESYVNGRWVIMDTTWDTANEWRGAQKTKSSGMKSSRYFDVTIEALSIDHKITDYDESVIHTAFKVPATVPAYAAPAISSLEKNYVVRESILRDFDKAITRGELASAFFGAYCVKDNTATSYKYKAELEDIENSEYKNDIGGALYFQIMKAAHGAAFAPSETITNQEFAQMLFNLDSAMRASKSVVAEVKKTKFADDAEIATWAKSYAAYCVDKGYMSADGNKFNPKATVLRQDALASIYKVLVGAGLMSHQI